LKAFEISVNRTSSKSSAFNELSLAYNYIRLIDLLFYELNISYLKFYKIKIRSTFGFYNANSLQGPIAYENINQNSRILKTYMEFIIYEFYGNYLIRRSRFFFNSEFHSIFCICCNSGLAALSALNFQFFSKSSLLQKNTEKHP
jgi:hypothetical protein